MTCCLIETTSLITSSKCHQVLLYHPRNSPETESPLTAPKLLGTLHPPPSILWLSVPQRRDSRQVQIQGSMVQAQPRVSSRPALDCSISGTQQHVIPSNLPNSCFWTSYVCACAHSRMMVVVHPHSAPPGTPQSHFQQSHYLSPCPPIVALVACFHCRN